MRKLVFCLYRWVVKLATFLNLPSDKLLHSICSLLLVIVLSLIFPIWASVLITLFIGISKEVYDKVSKKGHAEIKDLIADLIGILIGFLIINLW